MIGREAACVDLILAPFQVKLLRDTTRTAEKPAKSISFATELEDRKYKMEEMSRLANVPYSFQWGDGEKDRETLKMKKKKTTTWSARKLHSA